MRALIDPEWSLVGHVGHLVEGGLKLHSKESYGTHHNLKEALDQLGPHLASPLSPRAVGWTNLLLEDGGFVIIEELLADFFPQEITA